MVKELPVELNHIRKENSTKQNAYFDQISILLTRVHKVLPKYL
jgi:hypothetical protein